MSPKKYKTAWIVTIGNELTTGLVADANASFIARFLLKRGYDVTRIVSAPDKESAITSVVGEAVKRADFVVVTGGLGPTHDDITKDALCKLFKCKTKFQPAVLRQVQDRFKKIGKRMPETNRSYADVPTRAVAVRNNAGIAPGLFFDGKVMVLPGVPHEARKMISTSAGRLVPHGGMHAREIIFHTAGAWETKLSEEMKNLSRVVKFADVAFLPKLGNVDVRIIARGATATNAGANLKKAVALLRKEMEKYIWGIDDETIESVVGKILRKNGKTVCTAESCTGGGIGKRITSVAGSSDYFLGGGIVYSNAAKTSLIGVPEKLIKKFGAVSAETAVAMARGARKKFGTDYAVSATGVAGPGGGTLEKPVGLVFIAVSSAHGDEVRRLDIPGERETIRERTCFEALLLLLKRLKS